MSLRHWLGVLATAAVIGCGGSGGGGGGAQVGMFLTDDLSAGYDHVWANLYTLELQRQDGTFIKVFGSTTNPLTVDLRSLSSAGAQQYLFVTSRGVPGGLYTGARVTLGKALVLFPTGATTGLDRNFVDAYDDGTGKSRIAFSFSAPETIAGRSNIVIDFDLANWQDTPSGVTAVIKEGSPAGLDNMGHHEREDYRGTISGLSGADPTFAFTLNLPDGSSFLVKTDSSTSIYASDGSNPILANGETVKVRGVFSVADNALLASAVKIFVGNPSEPAEAVGTPTNINSAAGTFDLVVEEADDFLPGSTTVHVVLAPSALLLMEHGILFATTADFFTAISTLPAPTLEVGGTYDAGTNTLTAARVKVESGEDDGMEVEVSGVVALTPAPDAVAGTLTITLAHWSGASLTAGTPINITTNGTTRFRLTQGMMATQAQFFAALVPGTTVVEAEGSLTGTTLAAKMVKTDH